MPSEIEADTESINFPYYNIRVYFMERVNFIKAIRINVQQHILKQVYRLSSVRTKIEKIIKHEEVVYSVRHLEC
jgi:hypothetical protein